MKYFTKLAMTMLGQTAHSVAQSIARAPQHGGNYKTITKSFEEAGIGSLTERLTQGAERVATPKFKKLVEDTDKYERAYTKSTKKIPTTPEQFKRVADAKWDYEHKTKFYVDLGETRVIASARKGPKERVRPITTVTVGNQEWDPQLIDGATKRTLPIPVNLTDEFLR